MKSLAVLALVGLAAFGSANLIVNGSFEDPVVDQNAQRNEYGTNDAMGAGWTVASTDSSVELLSNAYTVSYGGDFWWTTPAGDQFVYLASFVSHSQIAQTVDLTAGVSYSFSFLSAAFKGSYGTSYGSVIYDIQDSSANSVFGGPQTIVTGDYADFSQFGNSFTASSTGAYTLTFDSIAGTAGIIDDVQLNAVPEPASIVVLSCGALAILRRRTRK
ncbi:MAG TPA: DUF642 domain-containing protein [Fimbriimonadaceae bacterium]|nr:DUF642 domain-containing protein [Fimbriimonadaceae bacterium]